MLSVENAIINWNNNWAYLEIILIIGSFENNVID